MTLIKKVEEKSKGLEYFPLCLPHQNPDEYAKELDNYKYKEKSKK